ncbi:MAG: lysophospholipid acyltransferase family protein [Steroidobacteraceae bacterium]
MLQWLGSVLFTAFFLLFTLTYAMVFVTLCLLLPVRGRFALARVYAHIVLGAGRLLCGLRYRVIGAENFPATPCVALWKHASSWETVAQFVIGRVPQTIVLKSELMWIPFFGWGLALLRSIPIDRGAGVAAVKRIVESGKRRLASGLSVLIFPEGTRMPAGETRKYGASGAMLASQTGVPVVPVAHDAGYYWPRRGLMKKRGTITVVVGKPINAAGREARDINAEAQTWIEETIKAIRAGDFG